MAVGDGRKVESEVLPVTPELVPRAWPAARQVIGWHFRGHAPQLDLERLYHRLLLGQDRLWVAVRLTPPSPAQGYVPLFIGVILTRVTVRPPSIRKCFASADPRLARSLTVHIVNGRFIESWISSAIERISAYARQEHCRQLFLLARKGWKEFARRFSGFDRVAYSRDQPTKLGGRHLRNRVGFFQEV